jgi:hypothetical protein
MQFQTPSITLVVLEKKQTKHFKTHQQIKNTRVARIHLFKYQTLQQL